MSGTEHAGANDQAQAASDPQSLMDALTFDSDVNEVFLLIDHISGRSEKSLKQIDTTGIELPEAQGGAGPVLAAVAPGEGATAVPLAPAQDVNALIFVKPSLADVLHRLCQIGYPPHADATTKAHKAAFVIMLKDRLNGLADPARGLTIAYTAMFVTATDGCRVGVRPGRRATDGRRSARGNLARQAYPGLEPHARCFAKLYRMFPFLMLFVLVLTASAYWDVGFGRTVVQRIEQIDKQRVDLLYPDIRGAPSTVTLNEQSCATPASLPADQAQTCARLLYFTNRLSDARRDMFNFAVTARANENTSALVRVLAWLRPVSYGFMLDGQVPDEKRPEATVAWILSVFSTYVLPAMFGFIGTLAAIMRSIQTKIRDSLLGPRDFPLSLLGLVVGPVAGLAVGLFYTPTEATTAGATGLAGSVSLSASGLGFLAGYGADAFFKFADALLARVFALDQSGK
jgi:hypothetical protein